MPCLHIQRPYRLHLDCMGDNEVRYNESTSMRMEVLLAHTQVGYTIHDSSSASVVAF